MSSAYDAVRLLCSALTRTFYSVQVRQLAPLPDSGPLLIVANHPNSVTDAALLAASVPRRLRFLAKASLVHSSGLGGVLRAAGAVPVSRAQDSVPAAGAGNAAAFEAIVQAWHAGQAVAVFPEGVSHDDVRMRQLRTGAARMLQAAAERGIAVNVVPVGFFYDNKEGFRSRAVVLIGRARQLELAPGSTARQITEQIARALGEVTVNAGSVEDFELLSAWLSALHGAEHLDPRDLSAACTALARWREQAPHDAETFCRTTQAVLERSREAGVAAADMSLAADPGKDLALRLTETLAGGAIEVPIGLVGALGFAAPYWATHGVYRVVGRTGSGGSPVKIAAGVVLYTAWSAGAVWLLSRKTRLSTGAAAGVVAATGAAHLVGRPLLTHRAQQARSVLTQLRLRRNATLAQQTRERLSSLPATLPTEQHQS